MTRPEDVIRAQLHMWQPSWDALTALVAERDEARAQLNIGAFLAAGDDDDTLKAALAQLKTAREALTKIHRTHTESPSVLRNIAFEALSTPTPSTEEPE